MMYGGNAEAGTVFTTALPHPATWVVPRYDSKAHDIEYIVVFPEDRVVQIDIECQFRNANETRCQIAYVMTALSEAGARTVNQYTQEKHDQRLAHFQMAINHYLQTGKRIEPHE